MTSILGISAFYHDSAAALVVDGYIICEANEEIFSLAEIIAYKILSNIKLLIVL